METKDGSLWQSYYFSISAVIFSKDIVLLYSGRKDVIYSILY